MSLEAFFKSLAITKAVREKRHHGRHRDLPGQRLLPGQVRSGRDRAGRSADRSSRRWKARASTPSVGAEHAHHRDPGVLQRSLDARDADALSRAPPGPKHAPTSSTPPRSTAIARWSSLHRGALGLAVVRLDGRLRRRSAVPLPDGRAAAADRGAEIPAPAHRHAEADCRPRRLLRLHLFGARRRRLPDVRHHADADLRSEAGDQSICATS